MVLLTRHDPAGLQHRQGSTDLSPYRLAGDSRLCAGCCGGGCAGCLVTGQPSRSPLAADHCRLRAVSVLGPETAQGLFRAGRYFPGLGHHQFYQPVCGCHRSFGSRIHQADSHRPFQNRIHLCRRHDPAACAQSPGVRLCRLCVLGMATVHCRHDCLRLCRHLAGAAPAEHHDQPLVQPGVQRGADPVGTAAVMAGDAVSRLVRLTHLRTVSKSSQPVATHSHSYL